MTIDIFKQRRSIKSYKPEQIKDSELDAILEAGTYAPTGLNLQSPVIVVIQDRETIDKIGQLNAEAGGRDGDPFYGAPTLCVVFGDTTKNTYLEDASLVIGNMLNAAAAIGVGGCWIHRAKEVFKTPYGKELMQKWGLGENYTGVGNCILGYADTTPPTKPRKENYIIRA